TSKHDSLYGGFQRKANKALPNDANLDIKEPIKECITRWNSYCSCLERGVEQKLAMDLYV
ncbi:hypothetical protein BU25DRAFT_302995, partial [Macroventuria anomochaeta]